MCIQNQLIANASKGRVSNATPSKAIRPQLPATAPKVLLTRSKLPVSVQFRLCNYPLAGKRVIHPTQVSIAKAIGGRCTEGLPLQIRITVEGKRDAGFLLRMPAPMVNGTTGEICYVECPQNNYGSILTIDPKLWDAGKSCLIGRNAEVIRFNEELVRIKDRIKSVFNGQVQRFAQHHGPTPTVESVKLEYLTGQILLTQHGKLIRQTNSIVSAFHSYYDYCASLNGTELELSVRSLEKRRWVLKALVSFLDHEKTPDLDAKQINQAWGKRFFSWLTMDGRMQPVSARLVVGVVRMALGHLVELEQLATNPLIGLKLPRGKKKPVVWLSPEQIQKLWQIEAGGYIGSAVFWLKVIILTGMDYPDAVRYVKNRAEYECMGIGGRKIVICRGKNESECHIPYSPELDALLSGPIAHDYSIDYVNMALKAIAPIIGFPYNLTTKVGRKTAGAQWMLANYLIHEISRFLGHSSIAMTESTYVKTSSITADRGMQRVRQASQSNMVVIKMEGQRHA